MINLLSHQGEFIKSQHRHTGLVGGFRSGKSHAGVWKTIVKKMAMPNVDVAYYLPTYPLIRDIAFPKFSLALDQQGVPYTINKSDKDIVTPYGRIICRSMDNPDLIIGYEVGYSLVDEADILSTLKMQDVMVKILARNSVSFPNNNNATDFVSTPEGFKFLYDFFIKNPSESKKLIKAKTNDNPFISDSYIASLEETYTPQLLEAYLNGEFVNLTSGNVYYNFDRRTHSTFREIKEHDVLHIGMDFNVTQMAAITHVIDDGTAIAVDEFIDYYDTEQMASAIQAKYKGHRIVVYPDASGNSRKSSASLTDIQILKSKGFLVKNLSVNPAPKDRINTLNKKLENKTYIVNVTSCPKYTEHVETLGYKNGEPDKSINHSTDASGYFVWYVYGKKKNRIYI